MRAASGPLRASLASPPALRALLVLALPALAALAAPPPPHQPPHQIERTPDVGPIRVFCSIVILNNGDFDWRAVKSQRVRRQTVNPPRGRYRGQTQSQYLAIDRGGKDEGKAEAHSAADSSRASVSGNSGMGQAQSQSMYDPTCDDCYGRSDPAAASLKKGPYGSVQNGNGLYGHDQNAGPGWTGLSGNRGIPGTSIYGKDQNGSPGMGGYGPTQTGVQNFGKPGAGNYYEPGKPSEVDLTPGRNGGYGPNRGSERIGPGLVGSSDTLQPDRTGEAGGLSSPVGYVPNQQGNGGYGPSHGSRQGDGKRPDGNAFGSNYGPTQSGVSGGYTPGQGSSPGSKNYVPGSLTYAPGLTGTSPEQPGTFGGDGSLRPNQVGSPGGIYSQTQPIGTYGLGQISAFPAGTGNGLNRSPGNFIPGMQGPNGGIYFPLPGGTPNGLAGAGPGVPQGGSNTNLGVTPIGGYNPDQIASGGKQLSPSQVGNWPQGTYTGSGSPNYLCCVVGSDGNLTPVGASVYNRGPANGINRGTSYYQGGPTSTGNYGGGNYETRPAVGPGGGNIYGSSHQPVSGGSFVPGQVGTAGGGSYVPGQDGMTNTGANYRPALVDIPAGHAGYGTVHSGGPSDGRTYIPNQDRLGTVGTFQPGPEVVSGAPLNIGTGRGIGPSVGRYAPGAGTSIGSYNPGQINLPARSSFGLGGVPDSSVNYGQSPGGGPGSASDYGQGGGRGSSSNYGQGSRPGGSVNYGQSPGGGPGSASGYGQGIGPGSGSGFGQSSGPGSGSGYGQGSGPGSSVNYGQSPGGGPGSASGYEQGGRPGSGSGFGQTSGPGSGNGYGQGSGPGSSVNYGQSPGGAPGSTSGYGQGGGPGSGSGFGQSSGPGSGSGYGQGSGPGSSVNYGQSLGGGPGSASGYGQGGGPGSGSGFGQSSGPGSGSNFGQSGPPSSSGGVGQGGGPGNSGSYGQSPSGGLGSATDFGQGGGPGSGSSYRQSGVPSGSQIGGPSSGSSFGQGAGPGTIGSYGQSQGIGPGHATGIGDRGYGLGPGSGSANIGNYAPGQNAGPSGGVGNLSPGQGSNLGGGSGYSPVQGSEPRGDGVYGPSQAGIGVTGNRGPNQGNGLGDGVNYGPGVSLGEGSRMNNGQPLYGTETNRYGGNVPVGSGYDQRFPGQSNGYNGVAQNLTDPNTLADGDDSEAEASVSQAVNGTTASASSRGGNDKGRAQTHVQGTYTGSGSFSAQALITGENKEAESEVTGGRKGASSSAQGSGRNNKSQANVQLGSETGSVQTQSLTNGAYHSSNSQVQGSIKGGMADAQARGPGSTSSQAQIGFTPYKDGDKAHDLQKIPFVGGGVASAQSSGRTGQSQSQLHGTFKYGISYNGAAQAGASVDKDAVFPNRLSFDKIDVFDENEKNINVDTEKSTDIEDASTSEPSLESVPSEESLPSDDEVPTESNVTELDPGEENKKNDESLKKSESRYSSHTHLDHHRTNGEAESSPAPVGGTRSFQSSYGNNGAEYEYTTDRDDVPPDEYDTDGTEVEQGEYSNYDEIPRDTLTHQSLQSPRKTLDVSQTTGGSTQHIVLGSLNNQDAEITQRNSERPDESKTYQPGERVPGTGGYTIPAGFTGSVKSVASKEKTYVVGSKESPSQAQTVTLTPGTGKIRYTYPSSYSRHVDPGKLRSLHSKPHSNPYVTLSKSVTRDLDAENNVRKQYSHSYYTKSSSCGFFTFTCTMVSGAEGRKKVCRPKIPTNPDGSPIRC
ncbi:unnamed protein product [Parnassius mnemosyne]